MNKNLYPLFALLLLVAGSVRPATAADTKSQLIQIQTQLQLLQDNMARMQQSMDERMGAMKDLMTQQTDNVNKISGQVQALHDAVDELKARLAKVSKQLDDIQSGQQNITNPAPGGQPASPGASSGAPPPDALYNDALRDFNANKNDLASQEFTQYLQVYGNTDLAGNAQFYLGEIQYRQGNLQGAVLSYNKVLDQYPGGNKAAAAQLKKGFALLELGQRSQGVEELRSLIARYPKSPEAMQARDRLAKLGVAQAAPKPPRPSPRHP